MNAFLHFGSSGNQPMSTVSVPLRVVPVNPYRIPVSGYGKRIPSRYMVKHGGRWRRVYVVQYSNAGTAYIGKPGAWEATVSIP